MQINWSGCTPTPFFFALLCLLCLEVSFLSAYGENICLCHCQQWVGSPQNIPWEINRAEFRASFPSVQIRIWLPVRDNGKVKMVNKHCRMGSHTLSLSASFPPAVTEPALYTDPLFKISKSWFSCSDKNGLHLSRSKEARPSLYTTALWSHSTACAWVITRQWRRGSSCDVAGWLAHAVMCRDDYK